MGYVERLRIWRALARSMSITATLAAGVAGCGRIGFTDLDGEPPSELPPGIPLAGMVGYWAFDEGQG